MTGQSSDSLMLDTLSSVPCRFVVAEVISGRYESCDESSLHRPLSWDERIGGQDIVKTDCGKTIALQSSGQQSIPQAGWKLLVTGGSPDGYSWTLYGMPRQSQPRQTQQDTVI